MTSSDPLLRRYLGAVDWVVSSGFEWELAMIDRAHEQAVTEQRLLNEFVWCVLSAGLSYSVVARVHPAMKRIFLGLQSAAEILPRFRTLRLEALSVFNSPRKIDALGDILSDLSIRGFASVWDEIRFDYTVVEQYSQVGKATATHLARNLGLNVAKPDRHLSRIAFACGRSVQDLTQGIADATGDRVALVDAVLWRFATTRRDYVEYFTEP